jgi:hypothetical protein
MDLTSLLGRGLGDHLVLAERVITQVVDRVAAEESIAGETPAERIALALGNRLTRLVLDEEARAARFDGLVARNIALASALGACDCWGEHAACPICGGEGAPGWLPPDPPLFATYVRPAARQLDAHILDDHHLNDCLNDKENHHD